MTASPAPNQEQSLDSYIILPRKNKPNILVAQRRTDQGLDWYKTHEVLHKQGYFMPTPEQFFAFLNRLRSERIIYDGNGKPLNPNTRNALLGDLLAQREPWRAEYLDAYFIKFEGRMYMRSSHRTIDGKLVYLESAPLEKYATEECFVDLSIINKQGLPTRISKNQVYKQGSNFYFWPPSDDSVAGFGAGSVGADFDCVGDPLGSFGGLGVRRQKFFEK